MLYLQLVLNGFIQGLVIGLGALAITLVFGIARFANAATGDFLTAGAYGALSAHKATGSFLLAGLGGVAVSAAVSLLAYLLVFRRLMGRSAMALLLSSIGVAFTLQAAHGLIFGHDQYVFQVPLARPYVVWGLRISALDLSLMATAALALAVLFGVLHFTSIGRQMRAVADNQDLARVSGIRVSRVMATLWLLTGAISAVAGIILGIKTVVLPEAGWSMLLPIFSAAILGGIGSPVGAIVAGVLLGIAQELSTPFVGFTYKIALAFVVMLFVLLVRPRGLFGVVEGVR
ncbi:MAG: branched-chain amino acid ABC transporter permease [Hyphomicrobiaceae bacterium]